MSQEKKEGNGDDKDKKDNRTSLTHAIKDLKEEIATSPTRASATAASASLELAQFKSGKSDISGPPDSEDHPPLPNQPSFEAKTESDVQQADGVSSATGGEVIGEVTASQAGMISGAGLIAIEEANALAAEYARQLQEVMEMIQTRNRFGCWLCNKHAEESDDEEAIEQSFKAQYTELSKDYSERNNEIFFLKGLMDKMGLDPEEKLEDYRNEYMAKLIAEGHAESLNKNSAMAGTGGPKCVECIGFKSDDESDPESLKDAEPEVVLVPVAPTVPKKSAMKGGLKKFRQQQRETAAEEADNEDDEVMPTAPQPKKSAMKGGLKSSMKKANQPPPEPEQDSPSDNLEPPPVKPAKSAMKGAHVSQDSLVPATTQSPYASEEGGLPPAKAPDKPALKTSANYTEDHSSNRRASVELDPDVDPDSDPDTATPPSSPLAGCGSNNSSSGSSCASCPRVSFAW